MNTLADAWEWYHSTQRNLTRTQRIGRKYWDEIAGQVPSIGQDDDFKMLEAEDIETETTASLIPIDDLAVVVLFSVFEAAVRSHVVAMIGPEAAGLARPILKHAANDAI
jgi:hypothetical protein